jgi:hypothetical protein
MKSINPQKLFQTWCVFGPSGGGKTTLCATAPKPIFLDSNQGLLSIAGRPGLEHVRSVDVHGMKDLETAYQNCREGSAKKKSWDQSFSTIVFDHFDDIQDLVLNELGEAGADRDDRRDPDATEMREWGIMGSRLRRYLRKFKQVPMHKILICGEREDRDTGRMQPSLVGALRSQLPYFCDQTLYLRIGKNGQRYLHLDPTDQFYAKTRAWWLPERKLKVPFDDTAFLSTLFARIATGPTGTSTKQSKHTEE